MRRRAFLKGLANVAAAVMIPLAVTDFGSTVYLPTPEIVPTFRGKPVVKWTEISIVKDSHAYNVIAMHDLVTQ